MPGKKILMLVGEFSEEYEIFVFEQAMHAVGHTVHVVCPDKKAGENIKTALHDFEGDQTYTEKLGHYYTLNKTFSRGRPGRLRRRLLRRRPRAGIHPHRPARAAAGPPLPRGRQADLHHLPRRADPDRGRRRGAAASGSRRCNIASPRSRLAGGIYVDVEPTGAYVDGKLVSAKGWPGLAAFMRECLKVLGTESIHGNGGVEAQLAAHG